MLNILFKALHFQALCQPWSSGVFLLSLLWCGQTTSALPTKPAAVLVSGSGSGSSSSSRSSGGGSGSGSGSSSSSTTTTTTTTTSFSIQGMCFVLSTGVLLAPIPKTIEAGILEEAFCLDPHVGGCQN